MSAGVMQVPATNSRAVELVAIAALVVRLAIVVGVGINLSYFDVDGYHRAAMVGLSGAPVPSYVHPPGYSWFILAIYEVVGPRPRLVYAAQALLSAATVYLVGDAARRRWGGSRAGIAGALLMACNSYASIFSAVLASETVALFGVSLVVWLLLRRAPDTPAGTLFAGALMCGALSTVRTGLLLLVLIPVAIVFIESSRALRTRVTLALCVLIAGLAVPLGYAAVRAERVGVFRVGSPWDSRNLWIGNNPYAAGRVEPMPDEPPFAAAETEFEYRRATAWWDRSIHFAFQNPRSELELFFSRLSFLAAPTKRDLIYIYAHGWAGERNPAVVWMAYWLVVAAVPLLMLAALTTLARGRDDLGWWLAIAIVALGAAPYLASIGDARFMLPFHGALAFAGARAFEAGRGGSPRPWKRCAATLIAIVFLANAWYDLARTAPAIRAVAAPGGSKLLVPYHFGR